MNHFCSKINCVKCSLDVLLIEINIANFFVQVLGKNYNILTDDNARI